tara:strand:- start:745 stop:1740 length:996 start_codon:yes stop_codon:yes gene_type:complete
VPEYYVVGGRQRKNAFATEAWRSYAKGIIGKFDPATGKSEVCVEYVSPPEVCADDEPAILFKAATVVGDRMYVCTETEVIVYRLPEFEQLHYVSLPCFNDVHHVRPTPDGHLVVVSTGLDMVVKVSLEGELLEEWSVVDEEPWARFSKDVDYRKVPSTKPHRSHPNHVFYLGDDLWVTRMVQKDALCLSDRSRRINVAVQYPHDGVVFGDEVFFTTVAGHVVRADAASGAVRQVVDLNRIERGVRKLGWCRGILPLDSRHVLVGFSRLRMTKQSENLTWAGGVRMLKNAVRRPSRVALYDLEEQAIRWHFDLEPLDIAAVFSMHEVASAAQ